MKHITNQKGQSLIEVVIALSIAIIVAVAFTNVTITSVRNAQFAKNQNLATKYAQQTIEYLRAIRDQDRVISASPVENWSDLWEVNLGTTGQCYNLDKSNIQLTEAVSCTTDAVIQDKSGTDTMFMRRIKISDDGTVAGKDRKTIDITVYWNDSKGQHSAVVSTYLTRWQ
jgi:Tfp pilus assembly protein PilV